MWLDEQGTLRKPLNRLLIDRHIPRDKRKQIWILAEGSHVLWVPALDRVSAGYYISDRTEEILCINMITESEKKMKEIVHVMFSREQVENRIKELADQINEEYGMTPLRLICILKGSVFFPVNWQSI